MKNTKKDTIVNLLKKLKVKEPKKIDGLLRT